MTNWTRCLVGIAWLLGGGSVSAEPPQRIVSLAPSITETVYALGAGERLVGVCGQCNHPPEVERVPRVGGYLAPSVEAVIAAKPDIVFAVPSPGNREAVRAIERAGVRVVVVQDRSLDDLWAGMRTVAEALDRRAAGDALIATIRENLERVAAAVAGQPRRRVLLVVGRRPLIVAGGGTVQDALLRLAGGDNVAADAGTAFPQIAIEVVVARAPDVILDAAMGSEAGRAHAFDGLTTIPAVRNDRIVTLAPDVLFRSGPRIGEAAWVLVRAIHPDVVEPASR